MHFAHLTQNNTLDFDFFFEPPFTNYHHEGPDGLFNDKQVDHLLAFFSELHEIRQ